MSYSVSTLLTRNLDDVFGENDPARRRAAIDEIFTEDCVFYEPRGAYRGRDEIDRVAGAIRATHPDFRYQPITAPEELGNGGRVRWVSGRPVKYQLTPGQISSLPGTAGLPPCISFSTSYPELSRRLTDRRQCSHLEPLIGALRYSFGPSGLLWIVLSPLALLMDLISSRSSYSARGLAPCRASTIENTTAHADPATEHTAKNCHGRLGGEEER